MSSATANITVSPSRGLDVTASPPSVVLPLPGPTSFTLMPQNTGTQDDSYTATIIGTTGPVDASLIGLDGQPTQSIPIFDLPGLTSGAIDVDANLLSAGKGTVTVQVTSTDGTIVAPPVIFDVATQSAVGNFPLTVSSTATGVYGPGTTIPITVDFGQTVTVTGTPQLALNAGTGAMAAYSSGSGTSTLTFDYSVASGQSASDLDYSSVNALTLNGGTIDAAGFPVSLTLPTPGVSGDSLFSQDIAVGAFSEQFTSGNFNTWPWQLSSTGPSAANWSVQPDSAAPSGFAAQSGAIGGGSTSTLSITITEAAGGEFSFWRNVSSNANDGVLSFYMDSGQQPVETWSGTVGWQESFYWVSPGTHVYTWTYSQVSGTTPQTAFLDDVLFTPGTTLTVDGTPQSDQFVFNADAQSGTMIDVSLNGENHTFPPTGEFTNYVFQGGGGNDTATLTGSPQGGNSALLYINGTGQLNNTSQDFAVSVSGMTLIVANGYAGDIAQFYTKKGVTGDNTYYAYADNAAYNSGAAAQPSAGMYGTGYANVANGFSTNIGYSNHAGDVAYFYGSTGSDTFYANADYNSSGVHTAGMLGSYTGSAGTVNYANAATGFATNVGNTLPNTSDTAYFYGAAGNDTYYAYAYLKNGNSEPSAGMFGSFGGGYSNSATGFAINVGNYAPSTSGNPDRAHTAVQTPTATGTAYFYDSPGNDVYYAYGDFADYVSSNPSGPSAGMYGSYAGFGAYANLANGFVTNIGESANGGSDTAYFYDAPGQSTFYADAYVKNSTIPGPSAGMYGSGYANSAGGFATNVAFATPGNGSNDTAYFYDSPGNDTYYAYADFIAPTSTGRRRACSAATPPAAARAAFPMPTWPTALRPAWAMRATAAPMRPISTVRRAAAATVTRTTLTPTPRTAASAGRRRGCTAATAPPPAASAARSPTPTRPTASPRTWGRRTTPPTTRPISTVRRARSAAATRTMPTAITRPTPRAPRCSRRACSAATATPAAAAAVIPRSRMPTRRWVSARTWAMRLPIPIPRRTPATRPICTVRPATTR